MSYWTHDIGQSDALIWSRGSVVAVVDDSLSDWQRHARLIAAAPAMLLALQELIAEREEYNDTGGILLARDAIALTVGGAE